MGWRKAKIVDGKIVQSESSFKTKVIAEARDSGWLVSEMIDGEHNRKQQGHAGAPDLTLCHPKRHLFLMVELKSEAGRLSKAQQEWHDAINDAGIDVEVWYPAMWQLIIEPLLWGKNGFP